MCCGLYRRNPLISAFRVQSRVVRTTRTQHGGSSSVRKFARQAFVKTCGVSVGFKARCRRPADRAPSPLIVPEISWDARKYVVANFGGIPKFLINRDQHG